MQWYALVRYYVFIARKRPILILAIEEYLIGRTQCLKEDKCQFL